MQIIEKLGTISNTITKMFNFVHTSPTVQEDFDDFLKTIGAKNADINTIQAEILPYILERRIGIDRKSIPDLYLEENLNIDSVEKEIITALKDNVYSVFEIKKVLKNGFSLTNLIDEKDYEVLPLVKMTNFRGIFAEQYMVARIFKYENEYYLIEVANILPKSQKEEVMRYAVAKIIEEPERAYLNNPEKLKELKVIISTQYDKFIECFGRDELIMSNKNADSVISMFNDYYESDVKPSDEDLKGKLDYTEELKYFEVKEFNNSYADFLENSVGGFSSHAETYDVAIIYDNAHGLFVIPFYATFSKIFEVDDYKQIENYKECLLEMLENDKVSSSIIERVANKYPNFVDRVNEILEEKYTLDTLLQKYKPEFLEKEILSSTTVLYNSKVFAEVMGFMVQEEMMADVVKPDVTVKVGRNDPCPCGSGKKYKKCCGRV